MILFGDVFFTDGTDEQRLRKSSGYLWQKGRTFPVVTRDGMNIPLNMVTDKQSDKSNLFALEEPNYLSGREMPATSSKLEGVCLELNRRLVTVNHRAEQTFGRMCARFNAFYQIPLGMGNHVHIQGYWKLS